MSYVDHAVYGNNIQVDLYSKLLANNITSEYNTQTGYNIDDYCIYNTQLYKCKVVISTGEAWNSNHWTKVTLEGELSNLKEKLDGVLNFVDYTDIKSFTIVPTAAEIGISSTGATLSWEFNGTPSSVTLNGVTKSTSSTGENVTVQDNGSTHKVQYTLATSLGSKTVEFNFLPKIYYGAAEIPSTINSTFILGLSSNELSTNGKKTFSVNATTGKYIWFASPTRYGSRTFKVGGFDGGFNSAQTVSVTNASGYIENYYVYQSTNNSLGNTSVIVS